MSGTPTENEIQIQWRNAVDILETLRAHYDTVHMGAGQTFDTLTQSLEGVYLPDEYARMMSSMRAQLSTMVGGAVASGIITPALYEYTAILGKEAGYRQPGDIFTALYEHFIDNAKTVKSRQITYDTATAGGSNIGNGTITRLTEDENGFDLEACTVERKQFICRGDKNSGTNEHAELFEMIGEAAGPDNLERGSYGSGDAARTTITCRHAGTGAGGSLLTNSSFSTYSGGATPRFASWTEESGGNHISQDTSNFYKSHVGATVDASLAMAGGHGDIVLSQPLANMRVRRLDAFTPYFLRIMVNKTIGSATDGSVTLTLGQTTKTVALSAIGSGWQEITLDADQGCWFKQFNQDEVAVKISWTGSSSGTLLIDDCLFGPWTLIDGTYWCLRHTAATPVNWLRNDIVEFTDTGGAPGTGILQYWLWVSGFGYLPHTTGTPTFTDPT